MRTQIRYVSVIRYTLLILITTSGARAQAPQQDSPLFQRVFGIPRILSADLVAQTLALDPGKRLEFDRNGDGAVDELWYVDLDKRHTIQPMLVKVMDEDGDMAKDGRGDLDSDLYFWDHHGDGFIDSVVDYVDDDGDNDLDQMGIFYDKQWPNEKDDITVWWAVDVGDDNLLWYDVNGNYYQDLCQWRTHFSGDELFYQFRIAGEDPVWMNMYEDPFAFYDLDKDLASEMVIRVTAVGYDLQNLRYSIDADDDAGPGNVHNYDFSVTALPPEGGLSWKGGPETVYTIRGIPTHPVLPWDKTKEYAQHAAWGKAMFIWDELNSNTDGNVDQDPNERWEGLLNQKSKFGDFPQVGGPPCGPVNKRMEVSAKPASPLRLYFDEADQRYHLLGAGYGYLDVDYNFDGKLDAAYTWKDEDGDGILDLRTADVDADGTVDFEQRLNEDMHEMPLEFPDISRAYPAVLGNTLVLSQEYIDLATATLAEIPASIQSVIDFYAKELPALRPEREIGHRIQNTPGGARLYVDLVRDRLFVELRKQLADRRGWDKAEEAYLSGDLLKAGKALSKMTKFSLDPNRLVPYSIGGIGYIARIPVTISLSAPRQGVGMVPVVIPVEVFKEHAAQDFNPLNCVVVQADRWLAWRTVPHQVDNWDISGHEELVFNAEIGRSGVAQFFVYYSSEGTVAPDYPLLTRAVLDTPAYVAWESDAGAYRFYTGQFDFFGKDVDRWIPRIDRLLYPIVDQNYHEQQAWGIDALHVGKTSGLGGLTLYRGGAEYPVQSPAGEGHVTFEHVVLGSGPVRSAVGILARDVFQRPGDVVALRCFSYAGRADSEIHVLLPGDDLQVGVGLLKLAEDHPFENRELGMLGTWGRQGDDIGEIGVGIVVPAGQVVEIREQPEERRIVADTNGQREKLGYDFKYWILGDWRRGMQYPVTPTAENWNRTMELLAKEHNNGGSVKIGDVQRMEQ